MLSFSDYCTPRGIDPKSLDHPGISSKAPPNEITKCQSRKQLHLRSRDCQRRLLYPL